MLRSVAASVVPGPDPGLGNPEVEVVLAFSVRLRHKASEEKARQRVYKLVTKVGVDARVYREVSEQLVPGFKDSTVQTMLDLLCGKMDPRVITTYCKECELFLQWTATLKKNLNEIGAVLLCSWLRVARSRGKSVPTVVRCALTWLEGHVGVAPRASGPDIKSFVAGLARPSSELGVL